MNKKKVSKFYLFMKRTFDFTASLLALIVLSPLFLVIAPLVKLSSKGPVFYVHERVGQYGKKLRIYKFRSMRCDYEKLEDILTPEQLKEYQTDFKVTNDPRITKIGKFLRRTSLDELPQLINIIKGNMSIVGPRPVLMEETYKYGENRDLFLSVKPGLTGHWQVSGRSNLSYPERIEMELYYIKNQSLWLDIKILFKTVFAVIFGLGAK